MTIQNQTQEQSRHGSIEIRGERLLLLPEKMVWWPARQTLLMADAHFGKAAVFRQAGIPVPTGSTEMMLRRIDAVIDHWKPNRLVILGDWVHAPTRNQVHYEDEVLAWRKQRSKLDLCLIRGNHDRGHRQFFERMNLSVFDGPVHEHPFAFCHDHSLHENSGEYVLAGHVHPAVRVPAVLGSTKLACFHFTSEFGVLPAFGEFTGTHSIKQAAGDRIFVIAEGQVCEVSPAMVRAN